ncbi:MULTISPECIES: 30S ribosomal protein S8 [Caldilinea]|jgi:small subunit ribosomal protein S8|uniref:Small ribosomal subunit protein uS8 n=1 Tax=Caldilinea aerophila TaxID=133453 RepID=A0A7C1JB95_9CHLR|nr:MULTISPECIES: 30S ribosomal protein S8 [Caldilinea]MBO9393173.1 30S ribosomal protein S8 [Caldilinea sp.]GIV74982.1 MAG: 30S ribosomal protein S8 [Caldilinea sp.]
MVNDPIADMLTRIRNASMVKQKQVVMPSSKIKVGIAQILLQEGFIEGYTVTDEKPQPNLIVRLKYTPQGRSVIRGLERVSRPGRRYYAGFKDIPWVRSGLGINIISTPKGLMTGRRARRERLGGEILCNIW